MGNIISILQVDEAKRSKVVQSHGDSAESYLYQILTSLNTWTEQM